MSGPGKIVTGKMTIHMPGVIRTLGESLYSEPGVAVRELLQNAHDTCLVRQAEDPQAPPPQIHVRYNAYQRRLAIEDNGAGMTADEVQQFLTVIGSSHTSEVRARLETLGDRALADRLIGRFGLGLLSAFLIGERIEFVTRSFRAGSAAVWWECAGDQEYRLGAGDKDTPGTIVTVHVKRAHAGLLAEERLADLIHLFADLLGVPIFLDPRPEAVNARPAPWHRHGAGVDEYRLFLAERYPDDGILAVIPLNLNIRDDNFRVGGALFVPKQPAYLVREYGDVSVYVRGMLVCHDERGLLPKWARFVRGVVESPNLNETTSRETLRRDDNFARVREELGRILLDYLSGLAVNNPELLAAIVACHNVTFKAWSIVSDELFDCVAEHVLFETDAGRLNLARYFELSAHRRTPGGVAERTIYYYTSLEGIGQQAVLCAAQGLYVIAARYIADEAFLRRYCERHPEVALHALDVDSEFLFSDRPAADFRWQDLEATYARLGIPARVVRFVPAAIPAVLLFPGERGAADDPFQRMAAALGAEAQAAGHGAVLYVNADNTAVQQLADLDHAADYDLQDILLFLHNNALLLNPQALQRVFAPGKARLVFEANTRIVGTLIEKIQALSGGGGPRTADGERK